MKDVLEAPNVRLAGLHCHIGSQIFALHSFREAIEVMIEFIARIKEEYGYEIEGSTWAAAWVLLTSRTSPPPSTISRNAYLTP